jgi:transposase, IS5 family
MFTYNSVNQLRINEFATNFEIEIDHKNRWVRYSSMIPWDELANEYVKCLSKDKGRPAVDARIVIGSFIIKHKYKISDIETIEMLRENIYLQYFCGLNVYHPEPLFDPSLFVELRKRMGIKIFEKFNRTIIRQALHIIDKEDIIENIEKQDKNKGKLKIDATVADQYIKYPTDLNLLNESRQKCEELIDTLYEKLGLVIKPRTYRREARRAYLNIAKKKNKKIEEIRKGIKKQLSYLKRDIQIIEKLLDKFNGKPFPLNNKQQKYYWVVQEVYNQQKYMYDNKVHECGHRIVSIHLPHVRPIVRGKENRKVEFGAKINLSLDNGFARIDRLSWDAFNEGCGLQDQVEAYKSIHGHYPELVQCDKIYATRENRKWLKENLIRITAEPLGRRPQEPETAYQKRKKKKENAERNHIEGKFGQAKAGYEFNKIKARRKDTSESWIGAIVFVLNLIHLFAKDMNFNNI